MLFFSCFFFLFFLSRTFNELKFLEHLGKNIHYVFILPVKEAELDLREYASTCKTIYMYRDQGVDSLFSGKVAEFSV